MNTIKTDQIIELEQPFIKVPYEQLKKSFRHSAKYIDKEVTDLNDKIESCISASERNELPLDKATTILEELSKKVEKLNKRIRNNQQEEAQHIRRIRARLENLGTITDVTSPKSPEFQRWTQLRLNRVIVDYLLREGLTETAKRMAEENGIQDMVDIQLFAQSEKVEEALQRHSCKECLQWCAENKSSLKKMKSTLEFNLRLQEHIELVRSGKGLEAVAYAKKYLVPWQATESKKIMEAMGLLAYKKDTMCEPFKSLYDPRRWQELITQFRADNYALSSLTSHPLLSITLQAGLSALKTTQCYQHENQNVNCPVCDENTFGQLAEKLPLSHHVNSTVVCRISGRIMNEDNPPMLLPNGRVYSYEVSQKKKKSFYIIIIIYDF
ncbi:CTLH/CRA C-terminal to lish motif domain-containing protein [Halteromyces radiatus]|uniref:CTLH/CRA C-terminal to lish motif domain-containing protein n=1 Tax=Halteromyces radiatus TaxID=101107 RepID=UPI00221F2B29|nr:CTLH/CRA C-terminal to lish motif domain-containing protein [Halteromyces radiatus]KAI8093592.1 CTLH/CRA C-terminal to lish motif domain-containing protein [Halteromyces radiatus]